MPIVEIRVLSGSRQGERFELDCRELRVGSGPGCDVAFDPAADPGAADSAAQFRLADDGWTVKSAGAGHVLVNHEEVRGAVRVRSGDVVRLSERGPDLAFNILSKPSGLPSSPASPAMATAAPSPAAEASPAQASPVTPQPAASGGGGLAGPLVAVAALAFCVVALLFGMRLMNDREAAGPSGPREKPAPSDTPGAEQPSDSGEKLPASKPDGEKPVLKEKTLPVETPSKPDTSKPDEPTPKPGAKDDWAGVLGPLGGAVWLLEVEEPKGRGTWPFATATAIREDTLLTSASAVAQLAGFEKQGFRLWAENQALAKKQPVKTLRVHKGFEVLASEPVKRIYFDLGLVTVGGKLPKTAPLASPDQLAEVEPGMPVADVAIPHEGEAITRFQGLVPELTPGKVFIVTVLEQDPASPRLFHVRADLPKNVYGSPVVDRQGRVLGVYAETAAPPPGQGSSELKLQYVVEARLVDAWLAGQDQESWVAPTVAEAPAKPPAKPAPK